MGRAGDGSTLSIDFTTGVLDPRITFSRSDATPLATFVNSSGLVTTVATAQAPRFDYDPTTIGTSRGLLIEQASTNVTKYSEKLNEVSVLNAWYGANLNTPTVPVGAPNSPYGTTSVSWKLVANTVNGFHGWRQTTTFTAENYTFSFWAKAAEYDRVILSDLSNSRGACTFVLTGNGTATAIAGTVTPTNLTIVKYGDTGWYRCSFTMLMAANSIGWAIVGYPVGASTSASGASYTGDNVSGVYVTMVQVEVGSSASSYIPTVASPVTRAVDTAIIAAGSNFSSWYTGGTTGTFVANWYGNASSSTARSVIATSDVDDQHLHLYQTASALTLRLADFNALATVTTTNSLTAGALTKGAFSYNGTATSLCLNGGTVATGTLGFSVAPTWLSIGGPSTNGTSITDTTVMLKNSIRTLKYFPARLSDGQIQGLTT